MQLMSLHLVTAEVAASQLVRDVALTVENTLASLVRAFTNLPQWQGVFGWNDFTQQIVFRKAAPFGRQGDELDAEGIAHIRLWFETVTLQRKW